MRRVFIGLVALFVLLMLPMLARSDHFLGGGGGGTTITLSGTGYIFCSTVTNGACTAFTPVNTLAIGPGSSTPHDLSCFSTTDGVTLEDCGAKTLDNGTIGNLLFKQTATSVNNVITSIDAHAASTGKEPYILSAALGCRKPDIDAGYEIDKICTVNAPPGHNIIKIVMWYGKNVGRVKEVRYYPSGSIGTIELYSKNF